MIARFIKSGVAIAVWLAAVPVSAHAQVPSALCAWPVRSNTDTVNIAYPDEAATYWATRFAAVPGARIVVRGRFPDARYISFHAYDLAQRPVDSLADIEIDADTGQPHRFRDPAALPGGTYTINVAFTPKPAMPEPNTLYAGGMQEGTPNPAGVIIYRVYVATDPLDPAGGVGLPDVSLEGPQGSFSLPFSQCEMDALDANLGVNELEKQSSFPDEIPRAVSLSGTSNPPSFSRFYGTDRLVWNRVPSNPLTDPLPRTSGGFLSNEHVAYMTSRMSRSFGDLVVMRITPPAFPDTRAGESPAAGSQLRYWSICQNGFVTQRVIACLTDHEAIPGPDGKVVVAISDPADRPDVAGLNWLPWGGLQYDGLIIYRHMLPSPGFAQAIQNVEEFTDPASTMGVYMPEARYCPRSAFEAGGWDACGSS